MAPFFGICNSEAVNMSICNAVTIYNLKAKGGPRF